jgi:hypothetical protein
MTENQKHTTWFRADMNATHSLIANLPPSRENRSAESSRQFCHSIYPDGSFPDTPHFIGGGRG